jgi:Regulator of chromosome condensation (RCC1) repeat
MRTRRRAAVLAVLAAFCITLLAVGPAAAPPGEAWATGNTKGQLGAGTTGIVRHSPVKARGLSGVRSVAGGWFHLTRVR